MIMQQQQQYIPNIKIVSSSSNANMSIKLINGPASSSRLCENSVNTNISSCKPNIVVDVPEQHKQQQPGNIVVVDAAAEEEEGECVNGEDTGDGYMIISFRGRNNFAVRTATFTDVTEDDIKENYAKTLMEQNQVDIHASICKPLNVSISESSTSSTSTSTLKPSSLSTEPAPQSDDFYGEVFWIGNDEGSSSSGDHNLIVEENDIACGPTCEVIATEDLSYKIIKNSTSLMMLQRLNKQRQQTRNIFNQPVSSSSSGAHLKWQSKEMRDRFGRKMLRCADCSRHYRDRYSLEHHICSPRKAVWRRGEVATSLINGQQFYFCPLCNRPFKWLGNLTRHYYVHTGQRFFKCEICNKEFFSSYQVKRHMNSHTGMRYKCNKCDKPFTCKYACAWHIRQHDVVAQK